MRSFFVRSEYQNILFVFYNKYVERTARYVLYCCFIRKIKIGCALTHAMKIEKEKKSMFEREKWC